MAQVYERFASDVSTLSMLPTEPQDDQVDGKKMGSTQPTVHVAHEGGPDGCHHCKQLKHDSKTNKAFDGWITCAQALERRETMATEQWLAEVDNSLTFAALFSGVVTAFIVESYGVLLPDSAESTIDALRIISQQLNGTALPAVLDAAPFRASTLNIMRNVVLFASLICALISAALSIFIKAWLRESAFYPPGRHSSSPREQTYLRQYRYDAFHTWKIHDIVMTVAMLLQLGVALFMAGIVLFVWQLHDALRWIVFALIVFWFSVTTAFAVCPIYFPDCPFKSPLARTIFSAHQVVVAIVTVPFRQRNRRMTLSLEKEEWWDVESRSSTLAAQALRYAINTSWGDDAVAMLLPCIAEIDRDAAFKLMRDLALARFGDIMHDVGPTEEHRLNPRTNAYQHIKLLTAIWDRLAQDQKARGHHASAFGAHEEHVLNCMKGRFAMSSVAQRAEGESARVVG